MPGSEHLSDDYVAQLLAKDAKTSNAKYSAYGLQDFLPRRISSEKRTATMLLFELEKSKNHGHAFEICVVVTDGYQVPEAQTVDWTAKVVTVQSDGGLRVKMRRSIIQGKTMKAEIRGEIEMKTVRDMYLAASNTMIDIVARIARRNDTTSAGIGITIVPTVNAMTISLMSAISARRRVGGEVGHGIDLDRARLDQMENIISVTIAPPSPSVDGIVNVKKRATSPGSDSDPLDAIIGPPPPPPAPKIQARGRGNFSSSSAMDSHFSSNYDPSVDVHPDPEMDDDWDQALEAIRDRQRWQKLGAERLKSAGFTEDEVKKWEKGGERREEDVKWKGRGEGREWDRGKVVGDDGVETRPEWGRLKGT
ncbi:MAG: hypothetical protein ASARMPREDX12_002891 [Alectoria sarmentosa]|nr:MAG: hypothetical protein ASARMPREDX12_002891 [Alectoria sarmentosa]